VNKLLNNSVHRDVVWIRAFKQDSGKDIESVLVNEWVLKKWRMLNPKNEEVGEKKPDNSP
jgi:hypothetical protein